VFVVAVQSTKKFEEAGLTITGAVEIVKRFK
jgi:hypothetical protein